MTLSSPGRGNLALISGPAGLVYDSVSKYLFIADNQNCRVRKVDMTTGNYNTYA